MSRLPDPLLARDAKRDIGAELLGSVRQMKAGKVKRVAEVKLTPATAARLKTGLSQTQFAASMGVSVRTLQDWEQGRREPSGAAHAASTRVWWPLLKPMKSALSVTSFACETEMLYTFDT